MMMLFLRLSLLGICFEEPGHGFCFCNDFAGCFAFCVHVFIFHLSFFILGRGISMSIGIRIVGVGE